MIFEVWAPIPERVELWLDTTTHPMERSESGWWSAEIDADPGARYGYLLDGSGPYPDPRSRMQPEGIEAPSAVTAPLSEPPAFDPPPLEEWVIYELHVGAFSPEGTYEGVRQKLDHLVELGVNAVELMPVNTFSGMHGWGYDGVDLFAPHHTYGAPEELRALIDDCHRRGLAVVLDVVYNHLGPAGNHLAKFGPYFTNLYNTPWGDAVNLDDRGSDEVRSMFVDNALMWLEGYGFDALRLDAVHALFDRSATHFLEELTARVDARARERGRRWHLIAESDLNDPRVVKPRAEGGLGCAAQWSDDLHHSLHAIITGERSGYYADFGRVGDLAKALTNAYVYDGTYSRYRQRTHGRPPTGLDGSRFLAYLQNHDQIGNRAVGDRISEIVGVDLHKVAAAVTLTSPFVPLLFMGEEWAASSRFPYFTSHEDLELARAVREGRRREFEAFGWDPEQVPDPQDPATFASAKLNWAESTGAEHSEMLEWYKALIAFRASAGLRAGDMSEVETIVDEDARTLIVRRGSYTVACNLSDVEVELDISGEPLLASKKQRSPRVLEPTSVSILGRPGRA